MGGDFQRIDRQLQGIPVDFRACLLGETRQRMFLQPGQIVRAAAFGPVPDIPSPPKGCEPTTAPIWLRLI